MATAQMTSFDSRLSVLETEVRGITGTQQSIISAVDKISNKMDQRASPQWGVYISAGTFLLGILLAIGTAWKAPIETAISKQETDLRRIQDSIVSRTEHVERWRHVDSAISEMRDKIEKNVDRAEKRFERLEGPKLAR